MSHEIRTPLNSIVGFSQVLTSYFKEDNETKEFASIIETSSVNLLRLINDVLDISYLDESEKLEYSTTSDINDSCLNKYRTGTVIGKTGNKPYISPRTRFINDQNQSRSSFTSIDSPITQCSKIYN